MYSGFFCNRVRCSCFYGFQSWSLKFPSLTLPLYRRSFSEFSNKLGEILSKLIANVGFTSETRACYLKLILCSFTSMVIEKRSIKRENSPLPPTHTTIQEWWGRRGFIMIVGEVKILLFTTKKMQEQKIYFFSIYDFFSLLKSAIRLCLGYVRQPNLIWRKT